MANGYSEFVPPARLRPHWGGHLFRRSAAARGIVAAALAASAALVALARCTGSAPRDAREADRVVSLAPPITELVFALGAGDRLVGRTQWCTYPPEARRVPSVGDGLFPNVEAIAARRPDFVVLYATPANAGALERLERLEIATVELPFDRLEHLPQAARTLGPLLGRVRTADSIAEAFDRWLATPPPPARWRVAFVVSHAPLITIGRGSFLSELARRAGAENVFADLPQPSPRVSLEALTAREPDALIMLGESADPGPEMRRPEWQAVGAVRRGRIVRLQGDHLSYPSLRAPQAVLDLRAALEAAGR